MSSSVVSRQSRARIASLGPSVPVWCLLLRCPWASLSYYVPFGTGFISLGELLKQKAAQGVTSREGLPEAAWECQSPPPLLTLCPVLAPIGRNSL